MLPSSVVTAVKTQGKHHFCSNLLIWMTEHRKTRGKHHDLFTHSAKINHGLITTQKASANHLDLCRTHLISFVFQPHGSIQLGKRWPTAWRQPSKSAPPQIYPPDDCDQHKRTCGQYEGLGGSLRERGRRVVRVPAVWVKRSEGKREGKLTIGREEKEKWK